MRLKNKAFTLIELLIVIVITVILLTIIGIPLVQGFNLTRSAQAFSEAQDTVRLTMNRIRRELTTAALVLDNSVPEASIEVRLPLVVPQAGEPAGDVIVGGSRSLGPNGQPFYGSLFLSNAKIDLVPPSQGDPGNPIYNPIRGRQDPTLVGKRPLGTVRLPVTPGITIVRYFIGLKDPIGSRTDFSAPEPGYSNPFDPIIPGADEVPENMFVLYRAEVQPYAQDQNGQWVPNTNYFAVDASGNLVFNDPGFFCWSPTQVVDNLNDHRRRLINWKDAATIVVQDSRTDLLITQIDLGEREAIFDFFTVINGQRHYIPRARTLATFMPARVSNEPAEGNDVVRAGEEVVDAGNLLAPEVYQTSMAGWTSDTLIRIFRNDPRNNPRPPYALIRWRNTASTGNAFKTGSPELVVFNPVVDQDEYVDGRPMFDIAGYMADAEDGNALIGNYIVQTPFLGTPLLLMTTDSRRGIAMTRFPLRDALGYNPNINTSEANDNLTNWLNSPTGGANNNTKSLGRRFVDIRTRPPLVGVAFNPLQTTAFGYDLSAAKIVPGSEVVIGPDQNPGANFGRPVRYTRVAANQPVGVNQYKINYTDQQEPSDYQQALGIPDPGSNNDVRNYIQPRFKKGYIEFISDPTATLPTGNILVSFDFQLNNQGDSVVVDYDSRQQVQVELTIRRFAGGFFGARQQSASIKNLVTVRNFAG